MAVGILASALAFGGVAAYNTAERDGGVQHDVDRSAPRPPLDADRTTPPASRLDEVRGLAPVVTPKPTPNQPPVQKLGTAKKTDAKPKPLPLAPKANKPAVQIAATGVKTTTISGYHYCGASARKAQPCIDRGWLVLYYPTKVPTLAGHDYKGWYWLDDLPNGRKVVIKSGSLRGTYKVYGHASVPKKGGTFPYAGRNAAVALQTCEGSRIAFSFLKRA